MLFASGFFSTATHNRKILFNKEKVQWMPGMRRSDLPCYYFKEKMEEGYLPVFLDGCHWSLVYLHAQSRTIFFIDSSWGVGKGDKYLRGTLFLLTEMAKDATGRPDAANWLKDFDRTQWKLVDCERVTAQQGNGHDCGVYTLFYVFVSMFMEPRHYFVKHNPKSVTAITAFRQKLVRLLFDSSLDMSTFGIDDFLEL